MQHTAYSIEHTAHSMQHTAYSIQHSIQHTADSMQHTAYSVRRRHFNSHTDNLGGRRRKLQKRSKNLQALPTTSKDDTSAALYVESCTCDAPRRFIQSLFLLAKISKDDVSSPRPTTTIVDRIVDHTTKGLAKYEGAAVDRRMASSIRRISTSTSS